MTIRFDSHFWWRGKWGIAFSLLVLSRTPSLAAVAPVLASVEVGEAVQIPDWILNPTQCRVGQEAGRACLEIDLDRDPYSKVEWNIRLGEFSLPRDETVTLEIQFFDQGAGLMEARLGVGDDSKPIWLTAGRRKSYTRLNTLAERSAWFEFQSPTNAPVSGPLTLRVCSASSQGGYNLESKAPKARSRNSMN